MEKRPHRRFFFEKNHVGVLLLKSQGLADSAKLGCIFFFFGFGIEREREESKKGNIISLTTRY